MVGRVPFSVTLIAALLIQTIIMGFTPQIVGTLAAKPGVFDIIGFTRMTNSWPFILIYYFTLLALFGAVINRLKTPRWKDYAFYLNHIGLLILLFASVLELRHEALRDVCGGTSRYA